MATSKKNRWSLMAVATLGLMSAGGADAPLGSVNTALAFPQVRQIPAYRGNYTLRSSRTINKIVIHTVEGSESSCINWFQNPSARVSAHYVVSHAGRVTQMVPDMSVAWHAGNANSTAIGIENEGYAGRNNWTTTQYEVLADLVRGLCDRYGIPKDRSRIVGHSEVPGATHGDPGRHFDWTRFMALVRGNGGGTTPAPAPTPTPAPVTNGTFAVQVNADSLNVRNGVWGTVIGSVSRGQRFVATASQSGWYRIDFGARDAWVSGSYVTRVAATVETVTTNTLNVRTGPSTGNAVIAQTNTGQLHVRLQQSGDWVLVQFDNRTGWIHGDYTNTVTLR
jgi:uncharacterized protein YraI